MSGGIITCPPEPTLWPVPDFLQGLQGDFGAKLALIALLRCKLECPNEIIVRLSY